MEKHEKSDKAREMGVQTIPTIQRPPRKAEKLSDFETVIVFVYRHMYGQVLDGKNFVN